MIDEKIMFKPLGLALFLGSLGAVATAQAADPAITTVQSLDDGLLAIMRSGSSAGMAGRSRAIGPVIDRTFDLPLMTRLSVGPAWVKIAPRDQAALVAAFRAMTVASYARNFDDYAGEKFVVSPQVQQRGGDKLVRTTLRTGQDSVPLAYRLRPSGGGYRIIDVYYKDSISQLATRRSDFAATLASGGARALIAHLNALAAKPR